MARQPTAKQKAFADNYMRTRHITNSAVPVYNAKNKKNAQRIGAYNLHQSEAVKSYIAKVLDQSGLSDEMLSGSLRKIIKASTTRRSLAKTAPSDGLRGIEMTLKLKDRFPAERKLIDKREFKIQLQAKSTKELQAILDQKLKEIQAWKQANIIEAEVEK